MSMFRSLGLFPSRNASPYRGPVARLALEALEVRALLSFQPAVDYGLGALNSPNHIAAADFNHDRVPDLVTADGLDRSISVLLGNGDGTFQEAASYFALWAPYFVATGDFDRDGNVDLVTANLKGEGTRSVTIWRGQGDGTFQESGDYAAATVPSGIVADDFNNDGALDVAVMGGLELSVLLGTGDGALQSAVSYDAGNTKFGVAVGDFNEDGNKDLATANWFGETVSLLLGRGDGSFDTPVAFPAKLYAWGVAVGDFDRDGNQDLAVPNLRSADLSVFLGSGDGTLQPRTDYTVGPQDSNPQSVAVADFNKDGREDLVVNNSLLGVSVLLGVGNGTFRAPLHFGAGDDPRYVAAADFNSDSFQDMAVTNFGSQSVSVLLNDGRWRRPILMPDPTPPGTPDVPTPAPSTPLRPSEDAVVFVADGGDENKDITRVRPSRRSLPPFSNDRPLSGFAEAWNMLA